MLPVDGISSGNTQCAAMKLNELFFFWMTLPDTKDFIDGAVADALREAHIQDTKRGSITDHSTDSKGISPPMSPCRVRHGTHSPTPRESSPNNQHLHADELDLAHSRGALSPRAHSPSSPTSAKVSAHHPLTFVPPPQGFRHSGPPSVTNQVNPPLPILDMQIPSQPVFVSPRREPQVKMPARRPATEHEIPSFYFPIGKESTRAKDKALAPQHDVMSAINSAFLKASQPASTAIDKKKKSLFSKVAKTTNPKDLREGKAGLKSIQFQDVAGALQLPKWLATIVFNKITTWELGRDPSGPCSGPSPTLTAEIVKAYYDAEFLGKCPTWRLFHTIRADASRPFIIPSDCYPLVKELLRVHPGLEFLKQTPEFMDKYAETVVIRIFYYVDTKGAGRITYSQFEHSNLPAVMHRLDEEDDINAIRDYFSYEHFYVLYCKFWELDTDRDYLISKADLSRYGGGCISQKALERIIGGHARKLSSGKPGKMNFEDFVWFCISEEDKTTAQAQGYWFRVCDLDSDGVLSGFEMDVFLQDQKQRMHQMSIEAIAIEDVVCQMIDMLKLPNPSLITSRDLRTCPTAGVFFNVLINLNKFLVFEQRDPFAAHAEKQLPEKTDWDRFARAEYDRMALEAEGGDDDLDTHVTGGGGAMMWGK